jgi:hypothetical protein
MNQALSFYVIVECEVLKGWSQISYLVLLWNFLIRYKLPMCLKNTINNGRN